MAEEAYVAAVQSTAIHCHYITAVQEYKHCCPIIYITSNNVTRHNASHHHNCTQHHHLLITQLKDTSNNGCGPTLAYHHAEPHLQPLFRESPAGGHEAGVVH